MSTNKLAAIIIACTVVIILVIVLVIPFLLRTYTLSLTISPSGAGSVYPSGGEYKTGAQITLTASPARGYTFVNWTGNVDTIGSVNATTTTITMNGDYTITANFAVGSPMGYS